MPKRAHHREVSDMTVTPETRRTWDMVSMSSGESQESATTAPDRTTEITAVEPIKSSQSDDGESVSTTVSRSSIRHRATTSISTRRALSPLPPAANLFSPTASGGKRKTYRGGMQTVRRIPLAIVARTCEVLLGPRPGQRARKRRDGEAGRRAPVEEARDDSG